jgi:hypothetical protein
MATLPWLCRSPDRCAELQLLVEELTEQMRRAGRRRLPGEEAAPAVPVSDEATAGAPELVG